MSVRTETLLDGVSRTSRIIEIGPSFSPVAPKSGGWNTAVLDHATRDGLVEKYRSQPGVDVNRIEAVDFVWTAGTLSDAVPAEQHGTFDVLLASHVIEHTPDFVAFFDAAEQLLKQSGTVILMVPDKRFCFDYFQPVTTTGQVLEAHLAQRSRHTGLRAFDHFAYAVTNGGEEAWAERPSHGTRLIHPLRKARDSYNLFEGSPVYQDIHAWHFVPPSFELLMLELAWLDETDWQVEWVSPTTGWEFAVRLRRGARAQARAMAVEELDARRMTLLKRMLLETQVQVDLMLAGTGDPSTEQAQVGTRPSAAMAEAQAALARCEAENRELRRQVDVAEAGRAEALRHVAAFEASGLWRMTALVRGAVERVRQVRTSLARATRV